MEQKNDVYIVQMSVTCVTVVVQQNINDSSPTEKWAKSAYEHRQTHSVCAIIPFDFIRAQLQV